MEAPDAPVSIQVEARTGIDPKPDIYYEFTDMGTRIPVSQQRYQDVLKNPSGAVNVNDEQGGALTLTTRPKPGIRAGIEYDQDNWTFWSVPTFESGQTLGLRSGSHLQLKILLNSEDFDAFVRLDSLWIEISPTLATSVIGEVARLDDPQPLRGVAEVEMGAMTEFVYDVKAEVSAADTGFDALHIRTGGPPAFKHLEMGTPLRQVEASEVVESADGLTIHLPEHLNAGRNELIRVIFAAEVFDFAWTFDGEVLDSQSQSLPQPVQSGDVGDDIATNTLRVLASSTTQAEKIRDLRLSTAVVTPNGDGINDLLEIEYTLLGLPRTVATRLEYPRARRPRSRHAGARQPEVGPTAHSLGRPRRQRGTFADGPLPARARSRGGGRGDRAAHPSGVGLLIIPTYVAVDPLQERSYYSPTNPHSAPSARNS